MTAMNQTIIIPINDSDYARQIKSRTSFGQTIDYLIEQYPEIFPPTIGKGYSFCGWSKFRFWKSLCITDFQLIENQLFLIFDFFIL